MSFFIPYHQHLRSIPLDGQAILTYIAEHPNSWRESIWRRVAPEASNQTVWRSLTSDSLPKAVSRKQEMAEAPDTF